MAKSDGSVLIDVDLNTSKANKQLAKMKENIVKTEDQINDLTKKQEAAQKQGVLSAAELDAEKQKLQQLVEQLQEARKLSKDKLSFGPGKEEAQARIPRIQEEISEQRQRVRMLQTEYNKIDRSAQSYGEKLEAAKQKLDQQVNAAGELTQQISQVEAATGGVNHGMDGVIRKMGSGMLSAGKKGLAAFQAISGAILSAVKRLNVFQKKSKATGGMLKRLGQILRQAFVFSVLSEGLRKVREQVKSYLLVNNEFRTALARTKGALLTAFQPIYEAVLPALTALINSLTRAAAMAAQFTSALFGKTAKQSQQNAEALNQETKALQATGSAAEDAAGSLAGFDEINSIQTEKKSGGGAAKTAVQPLFDYEYEAMGFESWGEALNGFLDNLLNNGIPRIQAAFQSLSDWMNRFSGSLYETLTFPGVAEKVTMLGQQLAEELNHLAASINWNLLGQSMGAGMNLALQAMVNFIFTFDWISLGANLAAMINGIVSEIDWYAFGKMLWAGFKISLETLAGFLTNVDMAQLAKAASDIAKGFFHSIAETLDNIDWEQLGRQVADFLANVDWGGVAKACFKAIGAAFAAARLFLWGLIEDAWKAIVNWWYDAAYEDGKFTFKGLLNGILSVAKNIFNWIKENIVEPIIDAFKRLFGIHSPSKVMAELGVNIMLGLLNGIKSMFSNIKNALSGLWEDVKSWFQNNVAKYFSWDYWFGKGEDAMNGLAGGIEKATKKVKDAMQAVADIGVNVSRNLSTSAIRTQTRPGLSISPMSMPLPRITAENMPRLATGAVIPPNREFMAILGDQKSGTNVEAPLSAIEQAVENVWNRMGGGGGDLHVTLELDGKVVARQTVRHINDMTRQAGKPVLLL